MLKIEDIHGELDASLHDKDDVPVYVQIKGQSGVFGIVKLETVEGNAYHSKHIVLTVKQEASEV